MTDIQEWVEGSEQAWRASAEIADSICKSDARILSVERAVETRFHDFVVCFRATVYSDQHKREAVVTTEIDNESMIRSGPDVSSQVSATLLAEFEQFEALRND